MTAQEAVVVIVIVLLVIALPVGLLWIQRAPASRSRRVRAEAKEKEGGIVMSRRSIVIGVIVVLVAAGLGIWLGVFPPWGAGSGEITMGAILPLTGDAAVWGQNAKEGIDLAVE
ncbi:hypothetical protein GWN63_04015, partial [Candidatus Bathyarchaeota archaeon]|nr:hypothetical protein [Desulfobacterales bacterium]NIU81396.1 hypothetical protein [Candidatus Bathyarchaeota archaeon]NIV68022.1 hypothetical protein [Candidatus Bathyarchaeota archaeon]